MRLLILGGTVFLGRHFVDAALARGHEVTLFNRGRSDASAYPDVEQLRGDRDGGLDALFGRSWDAVVDTSGYVPRVVRQSAELLGPSVDRYVFISTGSVYDLDMVDKCEDAPTQQLDDPSSEDISAHYGALKARCESAVDGVFGGRALHVRAGLIVGPHDPTERFTYWVLRMAEGGVVLAPGAPEREVQFIDARDLVAWTLDMVEAGRGGTYNITGGAQPLGGVLEACGDAVPVWAGDDFLLDQRVTPYTDLPLWIPAAAGSNLMPIDRALDAGLRLRPLAGTVADTRAWTAQRGALPPPQESGGRVRVPAGMPRAREAELLKLWQDQAGART
jgi:2'-hydroxyisoflavone reductase